MRAAMGIEVRLIDVAFSDWDALEMLTTHSEQASSTQPAVAWYVFVTRACRKRPPQRISAARAQAPFRDVNDFGATRSITTRVDVEAFSGWQMPYASLAGHRTAKHCGRRSPRFPDKDLLHLPI